MARTTSRTARRLALAAVAMLGIVIGLGCYTFLYAEGASYLSDNPNACANCHVMQKNIDAWAKSSHHAVATCNDCHAPHDNVAHKLLVKGVNGFNHSLKFTTGDYPDPIRITDFNRRVTEQACRDCHGPLVDAIDSVGHHADESMSCIRCHSDVGHPW